MLVFLPGFPGAWTDHGSVYELLEPYYFVIAPSYRGLGQSEWSDFYSASQGINDVGTLIHTVAETPALGIGHSAVRRAELATLAEQSFAQERALLLERY